MGTHKKGKDGRRQGEREEKKKTNTKQNLSHNKINLQWIIPKNVNVNNLSYLNCANISW